MASRLAIHTCTCSGRGKFVRSSPVVVSAGIWPLKYKVPDADDGAKMALLWERCQ